MKDLRTAPSRLSKHALIALCFFILHSASIFSAVAQMTAFTYQGRLNAGTNAANGSFDMIFAVYDANVAGDEIAGPITNSAVAVSNGLFTVTLDFGPGVFTGTNYWVQMGVSPAGAGTFAPLVPRQALTPAPYALSLVAPQVNALSPAGSVMAFCGNNIPAGWLLCNGMNVSRTTYANLFAAISTNWGVGDGATTFTIPDMRGVFLRGVNGARSDAYADPGDARASIAGGNAGNAVGSYQLDMFASHNHVAPWGENSAQYQPPWGVWQDNLIGSAATDNNNSWGYTSPSGGSETRPKNAYVNYIIKY